MTVCHLGLWQTKENRSIKKHETIHRLLQLLSKLYGSLSLDYRRQGDSLEKALAKIRPTTTTKSLGNMVIQRLLPFDAHNHIQLGPPPPSPDLQQLAPAAQAITSAFSDSGRKIGSEEEKNDGNHQRSFLVKSLGDYIHHELKGKHVSGMALMATHPRDFATLLDLEREFKNDTSKKNIDGESESSEANMTIVPCLGVHPWFLHELDSENDWALVPPLPSPLVSEEDRSYKPRTKPVPNWIINLESILIEHPHLPVGEIGLDNFHFDPITQELTTPMDRQVEALKLQLEVATKFQRPVSLHCVRAVGKLMDVLDELAEENFQRLSEEWNSSENVSSRCETENDVGKHILPPRLYFHAFGGKAATAIQLVKTLEKPRRIKIRNDSVKRQTRKKFVSVLPPKVYFGFAPPVNFQSPKTASVIQAVGVDRLVLETDREDVRNIGPDMEAGIAWISEVLGIAEDELVLATNKNARDLYGCSEESGGALVEYE